MCMGGDFRGATRPLSHAADVSLLPLRCQVAVVVSVIFGGFDERSLCSLNTLQRDRL